MKGRTKITCIPNALAQANADEILFSSFSANLTNTRQKIRNRHWDLEDEELEGRQVDDSSSKKKKVSSQQSCTLKTRRP
jgi:hypothetical protein